MSLTNFRRAAFCALVLLSDSATVLCAQGIGRSDVRKENLDLPYDSLASPTEEEESPEIVIFYGQTYEADATLFCLDRSLSMGQGEWEALQRELARVVTEFSSRMEFGIVFFDEEATAFPRNGKPTHASPAAKQAAIAMVKSTAASDRSTCFLAGLRQALEMANLCEAKRRAIIFMSDGKATCAGEDMVTYVETTLAEVKAVNIKNTVINSIGVGFDVVEWFLRTLAEQNRGTYTRLRR